ncbi:hypothetical protein N7516_001832 [Penicillium verrucosum]|uniref:uncharacterized protein n=1 Tax=Penicillium verrucosum TaxID=60171 RepID=UPI0025454414|nr:uncharacterized protein N7516_001832 [Penicillium verrucosum]KAJ5941664.1 hypothetical protein N7516_001832 [Penicillium verrucosum]
MSTLTPHHVDFTTLTFHLASMLYTENNTLFDTASLPQWHFICMLLLPSQHNEQQPGLQFAVTQHNEQQPGLQLAVIQHQNPPTSLFLLLCDDEWKILPTWSVADAG